MAIPTGYTEETLSAYRSSQAGAVADLLGWTVDGGSYAEPINDTLLAYGTDDLTTISGSTNIRKLRAMARRELWRAAVAQFAGSYDWTVPDGTSIKESTLQAQAQAAFAQAEADCNALGVDQGANVVGVTRVCYPGEYHRYGEFESWR